MYSARVLVATRTNLQRPAQLPILQSLHKANPFCETYHDSRAHIFRLFGILDKILVVVNLWVREGRSMPEAVALL